MVLDAKIKPLDTDKLMKDFQPVPPDKTPPDILSTRQQTHGDFAENARVSQIMKECFRSSPGWAKLDDVEREAMDMIALKFSRVLSGKSLSKEHWEDVTGYSRLVERICK